MTEERAIYRCKICGAEEYPDTFFPLCKYLDTMLEEHICYHCAFWKELISRDIENRLIINGVLYSALPYIKRPLNRLAANDGKEFYIKMLDAPGFLKTNNLIKYGIIPNFLRKSNPDNAVFLSLPSYTKLANTPFQCNSVGCWDRYRCARFNMDLEKANGPFNQIPKSYIIGSQRCPSFIDIYELKK